jgi:hypothetical protein
MRRNKSIFHIAKTYFNIKTHALKGLRATSGRACQM